MLAFVLLLIAVPQDHPLAGPSPDGEPLVLTKTPRCTSDPDAITVCGQLDQSSFRVKPLTDPRFEPKPIRARLALPGGAQGEINAVQRSLPGASAPAAMATLRIPFGGKKKK